jgi:hypothetical protein
MLRHAAYCGTEAVRPTLQRWAARLCLIGCAADCDPLCTTKVMIATPQQGHLEAPGDHYYLPHYIANWPILSLFSVECRPFLIWPLPLYVATRRGRSRAALSAVSLQAGLG